MDQSLYNICKRKSNGEDSRTWEEIAKENGISSGKVLKDRWSRIKKSGNKNFMGNKESNVEKESTTFTETDDAIHVVCDSKRIKTKEDVINFFNIDTNIWKIKEFTVRTSEGYRKDRKVDWNVSDGVVVNGDVKDSGKILIVPMMHTETKLVRREMNDISFKEIDEFFKEYKPVNYANNPKTKQYKNNGLVLEIDLADLHVGNESLTFEQVRERIAYLIQDIKERTSNLLLEKIILVQLGDIMHFDGVNRTTTGGTLVTYGDNFKDAWDNAVSLLIWVIEQLSQITKVEVINIYGNHDKSSSYTIAKAVEIAFSKNKNVVIDANHNIRKYRVIGKSLVAFIHGDMPPKNIKSIIQREARKEFGNTEYAEIHLGHLHHEHSVEADGVIMRYLPSITVPDDWHEANGFTGAKQGTMSFLWHPEKGLIETWFTGVQ
jgi:hypothetical protein